MLVSLLEERTCQNQLNILNEKKSKLSENIMFEIFQPKIITFLLEIDI